MTQKAVAYYRVSTERQGRLGLGINAQKADVARHVAAYGLHLIAEYIEVETGKRDTLQNRPELSKAIAHAKRSKATLLVAKMDRLTRSVYVTAELHRSGADFVAVDNPNVNRMTIQILAVVAENEVKAISERTKAALAAKKARGGLLGAARPGAPQITREAGRKGSAIGAQSMRKLAQDAYTDLIPTLRDMRANGLSFRAIAARLDAEGHTTRRGRSWTPTQVSRVIARCSARKLG